MIGRTIFRIVAALVLIAVLVGIGAYVYNAGVAQGLAASGSLSATPQPGAPAPAPYPYYYYHGPFWRPWGFGFFPFGLIFPILGLFIFFGLLRALFFRPWRHYGPGYWGGPRGDWSSRDVPPVVEEWHRKMHESQGGSPQPPQQE